MQGGNADWSRCSISNHGQPQSSLIGLVTSYVVLTSQDLATCKKFNSCSPTTILYSGLFLAEMTIVTPNICAFLFQRFIAGSLDLKMHHHQAVPSSEHRNQSHFPNTLINVSALRFPVFWKDHVPPHSCLDSDLIPF